MGKECHLAGKSSSKRGGGLGVGVAETETTPSGCMCAVFQFFDFHPFHFPNINQPQQTSLNSVSCIQKDHTTTVPKGAEAPRNSLESEDGTVSSISKEEDFKIPKHIQVKTSGSTRTSGGNLNDMSSEISSSPGIKTPTLVARLMGLDLLPGANSPSSSCSSCLSTPNPQGNTPHIHHLRPRQHIQTKHRNSIDSSEIATTHSLPETPRISSSRRSDVDHHRLFLQINKENMMSVSEDLEFPRFSFSKRKYDENNSKCPSHHARQIVKQVKESVSRKVGQDITNTLKNRELAREEFGGQLRIKKSHKTSLKTLDESSPGKQSNSSYSPRLRFIDTKHKPSTTPSSQLTSKDQNTHPTMLKPPPTIQSPVNTQPLLPRVLTKPKAQAEQQEMRNQKSVPKFKKVNNEKFSSRFKRPPQTSDIIRNKQEESFIIRPTSTTRADDIKTNKSKKTQPLSSNLLNNINTVPNLLPVKTDPSPPATKIPQKQVSDSQESKHSAQLSSCSRQRYKQDFTSTLATREISNNNEDKFNGAGVQHHKPKLQYITEILNRTTNTTTTKTTTLSFDFNQWFSLAHPLDPSIFHQLEHQAISNSHIFSPNNYKDAIFTTKNQLGHRWNRKLLFDLVGEVLKEILRPKGSEKWHWFLHEVSIGELTKRVCKRVEEFPCAKCEVLDDIDGLIAAEDMEKVKVENEEEEEMLVAEIEGNIWDTLMHETVMVMDHCGSKKWGPCP